MQSKIACNAVTLLFIKRKGKVGRYVKDTGHWEHSQMQLLLNSNEATLSNPSEVLLLAFKDDRQRQLGGAVHQMFDFDSCTEWKWKYISQ